MISSDLLIGMFIGIGMTIAVQQGNRLLGQVMRPGCLIIIGLIIVLAIVVAVVVQL